MRAKRLRPRIDTTIRAAVLRSAVTNGRKLFVEGDGNRPASSLTWAGAMR
jgi:hypothetical protein